MTNRSYSNTTNKHQSYVRLSLSPEQWKRVIWCSDPSATNQYNHLRNWNEMREEYLSLLKQAARARGRQAGLLRQAETQREAANHYRKLFKLGKVTPLLKPPKDWQKTIAKAAEVERKENARREKQRAEAEAKAEAERLHALHVWQTVGLDLWKRGIYQYPEDPALGTLAGKHFRPHWDAPVDFRLVLPDLTEVETTLGASFPRSHCERAFRAILACRAAGQTFHSNGRTVRVGHFRIDSIDEQGNVVAGCHNIRWQEIEAFAKELGLPFETPNSLAEVTELTSEVTSDN